MTSVAVSPRSLADHCDAVLAALATLPAIDVARDDARGAMLAADVVAGSAVPPRAVAACDGYALRAHDVDAVRPGVPLTLPVTHDIDFDARGKGRLVPGTAARIVSGAPLPDGADSVVGHAETDGGVAHVTLTSRVEHGLNVRAAGFDVEAGAVVLSAGTRLAPRHIAVVAALGLSRVLVHPVPRVVVVAIGGELATHDRRPKPGSVPETTGHLIADLVRDAGAHAYRIAVPSDDRHAIRAAVEDQMVRADVILTIGGLSHSRHDTVTQVLGVLGEFQASEVQLAPLARHGIGRIEAHGRTVPVLALPGRPVTAYLAFEAYVRDALRAMSGHDAARTTVPASTTQGWASRGGLTHLVPVRLETGGSVGLRATPTGDPANPSLTSIAAANGLAWVPAEATQVNEGSVLRCHVWDS